jgi:hypothetical protein
VIALMPSTHKNNNIIIILHVVSIAIHTKGKAFVLLNCVCIHCSIVLNLSLSFLTAFVVSVLQFTE